MKLGITNTAYNASYENPEGYLKMREHGYECADFQGLADKNSEYYRDSDLLRREREAADDAGISFSQLHGIWPAYETSIEGLREKRDHLIWAIKHAHLLRCKRIVYHPDMPLGFDTDGEEIYKSNLETVKLLLPFAEEAGVTLCIENMPFVAAQFSRVHKMAELVEEVDHPLFKMCLDTGHAAVFGDDCGDAVRRIGKNLSALHVHDNDGTADQHLMPYRGVINWENFLSTLGEVGFDGVFSFEASPKKTLPPEELEKARIELARLGKKMISDAENG